MKLTPVSVFIPGIPTPYARTAGGKTTHRFTPAKQRAAMEGIRLYYAEQGQIFAGPMHLTVIACYPRPKAHKPGKRWPEWKATRPDLDNVLKLVGDALNGVAWYDDAQIVSVSGSKVFGDAPGLSIEVRPL